MDQVLWFKKDLRVQDHGPLVKASANGRVIAFFVFEEDWLNSYEYSSRQRLFVEESLRELNQRLSSLNIPLLIFHGQATEALNILKKNLNFQILYSHQETGQLWTFKRDLKVLDWCHKNSVLWQEDLQFSVVRRLKNRDLWNGLRKKIIERKPFQEPPAQDKFQLPVLLEPYQFHYSIKPEESFLSQRGGRSLALSNLNSFLDNKLSVYQKSMSSPNTAYTDCSRLSPHITWGTLSLTEIHQQILLKRSQLNSSSEPDHQKKLFGLKAFESRLWWHCHFMQKLEDEPRLEFKNMNSGFDGMREDQFNSSAFEAWKKGETGFPFIDACMRALIKTVWINFRMRAMLISFASYQLWLHWEKPAQYLAKLFTDYEPGIHFSQIQMQSGVTGINAIRIYSPLKQSIIQDPKGEFIRQHCPELGVLDDSAIHDPQSTPPMLLTLSGLRLGENYPRPIVDAQESYRLAQEKIFQWRSKKTVKEQSGQVYKKHGSRKSSHFPKQNRDPFSKRSTQN